MLLALFALNSQVQAEVIIQGLNTAKNEVRNVKSQVNPIIQGYFKAVASGDTKAALTYYAWSDIKPASMADNRQAALEVMKLLKQQIDANGGLRKIELIGFFPRLDKAKAILEIEFNNGFKDIAAGINMVRDGDYQNGAWKLALGERSFASGTVHPTLAVAGLRAAMKIAEAYYAAALAGDNKTVKKLTYFEHWTERLPAKTAEKGTLGYIVTFEEGTPEQRLVKRISEIIEAQQVLLEANGGIKSLEVKDLSLSEGMLSTHHRKNFNDTDYKRLAEMSVYFDIKYGNGKMDYNKRINFLLDNGQWKVLLGDIK